MKKLTIFLITAFFIAAAVIFIPIIYDYFTTRSYVTEPYEQEEEDLRETALFAGGCFWCMEPPFKEIEGINEVVTGYTGGEVENPSYEAVSSGETDHVEAVQIIFDPDMVSYEDLLEIYWRNIDPTDDEGQFIDRGEQYRTVIFYTTDEQREMAEQSKRELEQSDRFEDPVVTEIKEAGTFYRAEEYHQNYYQKNPVRYEFYLNNSGREEFLEEVWGDEREYDLLPPDEENIAFWRAYEQKSDDELRETLTVKVYEVTQEGEEEPPYENEYWDNEADGIYVDALSGEPLFSSVHQFDADNGRPNFTQPLLQETIIKQGEWNLLVRRTEIRSRYADSHLGYVFNDGPEPTKLRYTVNSAAMEFIPKEDLEAEGYEEFSFLFND